MIRFIKQQFHKLRVRWRTSRLLKTDEGRAILAQEMVEPIRRSLEYQAIGRKLLMVDELPEGAKKQDDDKKN